MSAFIEDRGGIVDVDELEAPPPAAAPAPAASRPPRASFFVLFDLATVGMVVGAKNVMTGTVGGSGWFIRWYDDRVCCHLLPIHIPPLISTRRHDLPAFPVLLRGCTRDCVVIGVRIDCIERMF